MTKKRTAGTACACLVLALASGGSASADQEGSRGDAAPLSEASDTPGAGPGGLSLGEDAAQFAYTSRFLLGRLFDAPSRKSTYWILGGVLVSSAVLAHNKRDVQSELLENRGHESDEISGTAKILGNGGVVPALGLLLFAHGRIFGQPRVHDTGLMVLESALYTGLFTGLGQHVLSEDRPAQGGDLRFLSGGGHGISGHASLAASLAAPLSRGLLRVQADDGDWARFGKRLGTGFAYGLPVLTGLSRLHDDKHYAWNVVLGLGLGFWVGETVADAHDSRRENLGVRFKPDSFGPVMSDSGPGLAARWRF